MIIIYWRHRSLDNKQGPVNTGMCSCLLQVFLQGWIPVETGPKDRNSKMLITASCTSFTAPPVYYIKCLRTVNSQCQYQSQSFKRRTCRQSSHRASWEISHLQHGAGGNKAQQHSPKQTAEFYHKLPVWPPWGASSRDSSSSSETLGSGSNSPNPP